MGSGVLGRVREHYLFAYNLLSLNSYILLTFGSTLIRFLEMQHNNDCFKDLCEAYNYRVYETKTEPDIGTC